jgi:hypothetical protein
MGYILSIHYIKHYYITLFIYTEIMSGKQEILDLNKVNIDKPNLENINILI